MLRRCNRELVTAIGTQVGASRHLGSCSKGVGRAASGHRPTSRACLPLQSRPSLRIPGSCCSLTSCCSLGTAAPRWRRLRNRAEGRFSMRCCTDSPRRGVRRSPPWCRPHRASDRSYREHLRFFVMRLSIPIFLLALVASAPMGARASAVAATGGPAPVRFAPAAGWHVRTGKVRACPGVAASRCSAVTSVAATIRWRDCLHCRPHRTLGVLPPGGIAIQVTVVRERPTRIPFRFSWPPTIRPSHIEGLEGVPDHIGVYQRSTRIGAREVFAIAFFGRAPPTAGQIRRANAALRRGRLG